MAIWQAGVGAVDSARLVRSQVTARGEGLVIGGTTWSPTNESRICVVGAGKAGAGMASGFEEAIGPDWLSRTSGWVNVPADCVRGLERITLYAARPAGVNEPTPEGVAGTREIINRVLELAAEDLCVVLLSGGGSALMPAPIPGITLQEKQLVTRILMASGVPIQDLNCVRRNLSFVKGGGLLRSCFAGTVICLIISDVIGDPIETIASGPTVSIAPNPAAALAILNDVASRTGQAFPDAVLARLQERIDSPVARSAPTCTVANHVIGNNRTAVDAAVRRAVELGYDVRLQEHDQAGLADVCGVSLARKCREIRANSPPGSRVCLISGGEPLVRLVRTLSARKGGRNQELVLAAVQELWDTDMEGIAILSGGTDGEDGPTDAAGAIADADVMQAAKAGDLDVQPFLEINNSYPFFERTGGLIKTGPTHTNVMDMRVALITT